MHKNKQSIKVSSTSFFWPPHIHKKTVRHENQPTTVYHDMQGEINLQGRAEGDRSDSGQQSCWTGADDSPYQKQRTGPVVRDVQQDGLKIFHV